MKADEHRVTKCGRVSTGGTTRLATASDGQAHYRGLQTCGSITVCPVCSAKVRHRRAQEIDAGLAVHLARGGGAVFATLTMPHARGMGLDALWAAVSGSWGALVSGRHRAGLRDRFALAGYVRAVEVTHGGNGWHPHLHVLLLTDRVLTLDELRELHIFVRERWIRRVVALGYRPPDIHHGLRLLPVYSGNELGGYLSKVDPEGERGPGAELSRADVKRGQGGSRTPFEILGDHVEHERPADWALFSEWITASKGRHMIEWSPGLRARLLPDEPELTDQEIAAEHEPGEELADIDPLLWAELLRRDLTDYLLPVAEVGGLAGVLDWLAQLGIAVRAEEQDRGPPLLRLALRGAIL